MKKNEKNDQAIKSELNSDVECINSILQNDEEKFRKNFILTDKNTFFSKSFSRNIYSANNPSKQVKVQFNALTFAIFLKVSWAVKIMVNSNAPMNNSLVNFPGVYNIKYCPLLMALESGSDEIADILLESKTIDVHKRSLGDNNHSTSAFEFACAHVPSMAVKMLSHPRLQTSKILEPYNTEQSLLPINLVVGNYLKEKDREQIKKYFYLLNSLLEIYKKRSVQIPLEPFLKVCAECDKLFALAFINAEKDIITRVGHLSGKSEKNLKLPTFTAMHSAVCSNGPNKKEFIEFLLNRAPQSAHAKAISVFPINGHIYYAETSALLTACHSCSVEIIQSLTNTGIDVGAISELKLLKDDAFSIQDNPYLSFSGAIDKKSIAPRKETINLTFLEMVILQGRVDVANHLLMILKEQEPKEKVLTLIQRAAFLAFVENKCIDLFVDYLNTPLQAKLDFISVTPSKKFISTTLYLPLCISIYKKHPKEIIQLLVTSGANISPEFLLENKEDGLKEQIKDDAFPINLYPLAQAIYRNPQSVELLLELGANPTINVYYENQIFSLLHWICKCNSQDLANCLGKFFEIWKEKYYSTQLPILYPLLTCIDLNKFTYFERLLTLKNIGLNTDYDLHQFVLILLSLSFLEENIPNVFFKEEDLSEIKVNFRNREEGLVTACIYLNKISFYTKLLRYSKNIYLTAEDILNEKSPSAFEEACYKFSKTPVYLCELLKKYFALKGIQFDQEAFNIAPIHLAIKIGDCALFRKLLNNIKLTNDQKNTMEDFAKSMGNDDILKVLACSKEIDASLRKEILLSQGFQTPIFNKTFLQGNDALYISYKKNQLISYLNLLSKLGENNSTNHFPKHFLLFRFYEVLLELNRKKVKGKVILSPKLVNKVRNRLAHSYHDIQDEEWEKLINETLNLAKFIQVWQNDGVSANSPIIQGIIDFSKATSNEDLNINAKIMTIKDQLEKINVIYAELLENESNIGNSVFLRIQECAWLIGECYQAINFRHLGENDYGKARLNSWSSDRVGFEVSRLMEATRYIRRVFSHEIAEDKFCDEFNQHYLIELVKNFYDSREEILEILNQFAVNHFQFPMS